MGICNLGCCVAPCIRRETPGKGKSPPWALRRVKKCVEFRESFVVERRLFINEKEMTQGQGPCRELELHFEFRICIFW